MCFNGCNFEGMTSNPEVSICHKPKGMPCPHEVSEEEWEELARKYHFDDEEDYDD